MKLIWHLVKADLRHLRWPLVIWALAVGVNLACNAYQLTLPARIHWPLVLADFLNLVSTVTRWGLTVVMAAQVILADPLRGSTAFWLTRPIAGGRLLAAKLLVLAALSLLPAVLTGATVAAFGLGGRAILAAVVQTAVTGGVAVLIAAVYATIADGFGSFVLRGMIILAGCGFVASIFAAMAHVGRLVEGEMVPTDSLATSGLWVFRLAILFGGAGFVGWQYLQRHIRLGLTVACLGTVLVMALPSFWRWDFLGGGRAAYQPAPGTRPALVLHSSVLRTTGSFDRYTRLAGEIECTAHAADFILEPVATGPDVELKWPDGCTQGAMGAQSSFPSPIDLTGCEPGVLERSLAPLRLLNPPRRSSRLLNLLMLDNATAQRLGREPATLRAEVDARLHRYVIEAEMPLAAGAAARGGAWKAQIEQVSAHGDGVRLTLKEDVYHSALAGELEQHNYVEAVVIPFFSPRFAPRNVCYLLVNRSRGEALLPARSPAFLRQASFGSLRAWRQQMEFATGGLGLPPAEWLRGATLLRVRLEDLGRVMCSLKAEGVTAKL